MIATIFDFFGFSFLLAVILIIVLFLRKTEKQPPSEGELRLKARKKFNSIPSGVNYIHQLLEHTGEQDFHVYGNRYYDFYTLIHPKDYNVNMNSRDIKNLGPLELISVKDYFQGVDIKEIGDKVFIPSKTLNIITKDKN